MPDIQGIQEQVQARLDELGKQIDELTREAAQLTKIAGILDDTSSAALATVAAPAPASAARRASSPRRATRAAKVASAGNGSHRGGNRGQQALELIAARPGLTAAELADSMGMKRNYLYRVLPALQKEGKIAKEGTGYHPVAGAQKSAGAGVAA